MPKLSLPRHLSAPLLGLLLAAATPVFGAEAAKAETAKPMAPELTAQIFYQYLLAEIAGARGQSPLAVSAMSDLALQTQDPGIARRAAELALYARNYNEALAAVRIWLAHEPDSDAANQMIISLLAALGRTDELQGYVARNLAQKPLQSPEMLMRLNRLFVRMNDKGEVRKIVEQLTEPYLNLPEAYFARAQAAYAAEQSEPALAALDKAVALRPNWEAAILFKAVLLHGQPAQVVATLAPFVRDNPTAVEARITLARALVAEKRFDEALAQFERAHVQQPDNLEIRYAIGLISLQLGKIPQAEGHFQFLIDKGFPESNVLRTYLGQIAEDRKNIPEAINWYRQVTDGPQYQAAQNRAAKLLAQSGQLDEARAVLRSLPANTAAEKAQRSISEAFLLSEAHQYAAAQNVLETALKATPEQPELLYETAMAADKAGDFARMETLLRQLIKQKPEHAHAYNALGYSFADRGIRLDEAQQLIDKALSITPEDPFILDSKGWVLYRRGELGAAVSALQQALSLRADPEIAAHLGEVLWAMGRQPEAKKLWSDYARSNPGNQTLADTIKKFAP